MRSLFTGLLACLFAVMVIADRFACPDGCTDEAPTQAAQQVSAPCAICQGWSAGPSVVPSRPAPRQVATQLVIVTSPTEPTLPTVERPPKNA